MLLSLGLTKLQNKDNENTAINVSANQKMTMKSNTHKSTGSQNGQAFGLRG